MVNNVDRLSDLKLEILKNNIARNNGRVVLVIHPFMNYSEGKNPGYKNRILKLLSKSKRPVIILEEKFLSNEPIY